MKPVTMSCLLTDIEFRHRAHDLKIGNTTVFHCDGYPLTKPKPKVKVYWGEPLMKSSIAYRPGFKMWVGKCEGCDHVTQYWSWGASLGHMLEHQWIGCEGDKRRGADRRRKYARLAIDPDTEAEARLSCGGRTHGIMGEDRGSTVRRAEVSTKLPTFSAEPSQEAGTEQTARDRAWSEGKWNV